MFSKEEMERYSRHLIIPEFNIEGQKKLKAAKVLVIGCGGLGAPLLSYLVAAGVGTVGILDYDVIDASNLHRQVLFTLEDIGKSKVEVAAKRLKLQNPFIQFHTYNYQITSDNALDVIKDYDVVADGTDNFPTRYLVNDACVLLGKVNVYASVYRFEGQLSVFNYLDKYGNFGPNYRDLFPSPPPPHLVPNCAEGGVIGVLPGIMGSLQANEVIKVITNMGEPLSGKLFVFDTLSFESRTLSFKKNPENPLNGDHPHQKGLINYEEFCGINISTKENAEHIREISAEELHQIMQENEDFQIIDVRHPYEYEIANLGGILIPLMDLEDQLDKISKEKKVIIHCRSGQRSRAAIKLLQEKYSYRNLTNLKGGILAWADKIDREMPRY